VGGRRGAGLGACRLLRGWRVVQSKYETCRNTRFFFENSWKMERLGVHSKRGYEKMLGRG
jgi:hypothetical protein